MAELKSIASQIRRDILRMVNGASSGHPGGSLGCTEYFTSLYFSIMQHNPKFTMDAKNDVRQELTNRVLAYLDAGTVPWRKAWTSASSRPINAKTQKAYSGIIDISVIHDNR